MRNIRMTRRRESRTDYPARITMLKSNSPRVTFRKTNRYIIGAYIKSKESQDSVILSVNSKELEMYGWNGYSIKNIPACYLTGLLLGKKIIDKKEDKNVIIDLGLIRNISKSRIYAFIKGLKDAEVIVKCEEEMFPSEERINGKHINESVEKMFEKVKKDLHTHYKTINKGDKK
jgi:large subunit ribosomal protein L18